jgi:hypothetical protein
MTLHVRLELTIFGLEVQRFIQLSQWSLNRYIFLSLNYFVK